MRYFPRLAAILIAFGSFHAPAAALAQDVPELSAEALARFAEGMAHYQASEYTSAAAAFEEAYSLDPSFYLAAFFAGLTWGNAGDGAKAGAAYAYAVTGRDRLSAYYRHRLDAQLAARAGDRERAVEENRTAARLAPGSKAVYNVAQLANRMRRPALAVEALTTLDPDRPPMKGWSGYGAVLTRAYHDLGQHEAELTAAREYRRRFPEVINAFYAEGRALAALGRLSDLERLIPAFEAASPFLGRFLVTVGAEAEAHGHANDARRLLDRSIAWYDALPPDRAAASGVRNWRAFAHYSRGEHDAARELFRGLVAEQPDNDGWRAWVAIIAAEKGDRQAGEAEIRRLLDKETPADGGLLSIYAASIAGVLGDAPRAVRLLEAAEAAGRAPDIWTHRGPWYRRIRSDRGFQEFHALAATLTGAGATSGQQAAWPEYSDEQRWSRLGVLSTVGTVAAIAYATQHGATIESFGRWWGDLFAPGWGQPGSYGPLQVMRGMRRNLLAWPGSEFEILSQDENSVTARANRPWVAYFGDDRLWYGVTVDEFERLNAIFMRRIAEYHGLEFREQRDGDWWVLTFARRSP